MSFSKAPLKRFNESDGCAPPPGHYSVSSHDKSVGVLKFDNNLDRFKCVEPLSSTENEVKFTSPAPPRSSKKKLNFASTLQGEKKETEHRNVKSSPCAISKEKQAYEREIRRLLQQCNSGESEVKSCRLEISRLEARIAVLNKNKLSLESKVTIAEKSVSTLQKKNELLCAQEAKKQKGEAMELELKKAKSQLQSFKQQLEHRNMKVTSLESDLQATKMRISALQEANKNLEQLNSDIEKHGDDVTEQVGRLQALTDRLRAENSQLQEGLRSAKAIVSSTETRLASQLQAAVEESKMLHESKVKDLNTTLDQYRENLQRAQNKAKQQDLAMNDLKTSSTQLQDEKSTLESELERIKDAHELCAGVQSDLTSQIDCLSKRLQAAECLSEDVQVKLAETEDNLKRVSKENEEALVKLTKECETYRSDLDNEKEAASLLKTQLDESTASGDKLHGEVKTLSESNEELKLTLQNATTEVSQFQATCDSLSSKLSFAETENNALTDRMSELISELTECKARLSEEEDKSDALESQLLALSKTDKSRQEKESELEKVIESLKQSAKDVEDANQSRLNEFTRRILDTQKKLNQRDNELKLAKEETESVLSKLQTLQSETDEKNASKDKEIECVLQAKDNLEKKTRDLQEDLTKMQQELDAKNTGDETERWKFLYEELQEKVKPFQSQLDAYSAERSMMLSETNAAHAELSQLGKKYAELLGHQNHKQKIRHVVKIKEENFTLKQQNLQLKNQVSSLQKQVVANRKSKLDPSKAFQHEKENTNPSVSV